MKNQIGFFDDIERLRGFACIMILVQHIAWICRLRFIFNVVPPCLLVGDGGVHIFFAISGFIVTLMMREKLTELSGGLFLNRLQSARSTLFSFYKKRFFRIFPVVFFVTIMVGVYMSISEKDSEWVAPLVRSLIEIFSGVLNNSVDTFVLSEKIHIAGIGEFWTLAVESMFYLLWPIALLLCRDNNSRAIFSLSLGCLFLFVVQPLCGTFFGLKYYMIHNNVSCLFLGSFFAFVYDSEVGKNFSKNKAMLITAALGMIVWYYPNSLPDKNFYCKITPCVASVLLVAFTGFIKGSFDFPIIGKLFQYIGSRSYSFYAVQLSLANYIVWYTNSIYFPKDSLSEYDFFAYQLVIFFIALFVVTELVYRFIEKPFRELGRK
jgi:peptidoglycan/LPS O-acetylase OafA/YrhL